MKQEIHFENIENIIIKNIDNSKKHLFIAVAWLTNINIINSIIYAAKKGVIVKLLINDDEINNTLDYDFLIENKIVLKFSNNLMHNKFCIIDGLKVLNGSYNWTKKANYNNENLSVIYDSKIIEKFQEEFNNLFYRGYNFKIDDRNYDDILKKLKINTEFPYIIKMFEEKNTSEKLMEKPYILIRSSDDISNIISIIKDAYLLKYNLNTWYSLINYYTRFFSSKNDLFFIFDAIVTPVELKDDKIYLRDYNFLIIEKRNKSYIGGIVYKINQKGEFMDVIDYHSKNSKFDYYKQNPQNTKESIICNKDLFNLEKLENLKYEYIETIENQKLLICKSNNLYGLLNYNFEIIVDFVNSDYFLEDNHCKFVETNALMIEEFTFFFKKQTYLVPQIRRIESNNQKNSAYWGSRFETIYDFQNKEIIKLKKHDIDEYFFFSYSNYKFKNLYINLIGKRIEHTKFHEILKFYETNKNIEQIIKKFDL